jgi:hypothetical protein
VPAFQCRLVFLQAGIVMDAVIDEVFSVKLIRKFESSPAEDFFEGASGYRLVFFWYGGGEQQSTYQQCKSADSCN